MEMVPLTKVIRVRNAHLEKLAGARTLKEVESILQKSSFNLLSDDGFFVTYENSQYSNQNRNTLVYIGSSDDVRHITYAVLNPE